MKEILVELSTFNVWASQLLLNAILQLPEETQMASTPSSFPSLYKTVLHMWDAESIWWQRMKLQERIIIQSESFTGDMNELASQLLRQSRQWNEWVIAAHDHMLSHVFRYQNSKREQFKQPIYEMLIHVFNHNTYHRGQLVTMMRQLGVDKIPQTDFIAWSRRRQSLNR
ncbi:MAG TPA: DinB family protein [Flavisolibacter sp.]|nr:DinB family protein [Flavisolibacter sp.]